MPLIDSDIAIDWLNGKLFRNEAHQHEFLRRSLSTTTITVFEVWSGLRTPQERAGAAALMERLTVLPLDRAAARAAADVYQTLRREGQILDTGDILIAGIALANGLPLLTRNVRHFARIDGLVIESV